MPIRPAIPINVSERLHAARDLARTKYRDTFTDCVASTNRYNNSFWTTMPGCQNRVVNTIWLALAENQTRSRYGKRRSTQNLGDYIRRDTGSYWQQFRGTLRLRDGELSTVPRQSKRNIVCDVNEPYPRL